MIATMNTQPSNPNQQGAMHKMHSSLGKSKKPKNSRGGLIAILWHPDFCPELRAMLMVLVPATTGIVVLGIAGVSLGIILSLEGFAIAATWMIAWALRRARS
jgi:hypothetical protein